ncbi:MAG TPA: DUF4270 domain-containing protein [Candidatus Barnesiella merdigallinarum]|nr:DUF4270 domain-containing protein [Candidatus Barnesiella merdigallinarum]
MKVFKFLPVALVFALGIGISSCGDENSMIGSSIVDTDLEIVVDSSFQKMVTAESIPNDSVVGRTITQLIGRISIPGYGKLETDFLTQFMSASTFDTVGVDRLDSLVLYLSYNTESFTGDSLAPMQLSVYPLEKQLKSPVYSSVDPAEYYNAQSAPIALKSYNASFLGLPDSLVELGYKTIRVKLPDAMAEQLFEKYKTDPLVFSSPSRFTQYFPGFYVKTSYGSGCVVNVQNSVMNLHYTKTTVINDKDSTYASTQTLMAVTPEISTGNHIRLEIDPTLQSNIDVGRVYLQAPAGLNVLLHFPTREIVRSFEESVGAGGSTIQGLINSLILEVPLKELPKSNYKLEPPQFLLFVRKSELQSFFEKKELADNVRSFYAEYNSDTRKYSFTGLRTFLNDVIEKKRQGTEITDADEEIVLVPVSVYSETVSSGSSYYYYSYNEQEVVTDIVPYISAPALAEIDMDHIRLQLTYSRQKTK